MQNNIMPMNSLIYDISDRLPNVAKQFCWCVHEDILDNVFRGDPSKERSLRKSTINDVHKYVFEVEAQLIRAIKKKCKII